MEDPNPIVRSRSTHAAAWSLDPDVVFLNHGSFGACPRAVLEVQQRWCRQMEAEPVRFFMQEMLPLIDEARRRLAEFVGADPADLVFVRNATEGVNGVLRSLRLAPGDELLVTDHAYNACRNVVEFAAGRSEAKVIVARVPLPIGSPDEVVDAILACVTGRTRLALLDHITSPTALILPIRELVELLRRRGVDTLVDGAHAPGMVPLDLGQIGAAYYTGNCHKWLCAPKGAGFLHVRPDRQEGLHPAVISHGFNTRRPDRVPLHVEFDWTGTADPSPWLCVGEAIRFLEGLMPGGIEGLMRHNHALALEARRVLCETLDLSPLCPEEMIGSMAAVQLPDEPAATPPTPPWVLHLLQRRLLEESGIEVPVYYWPAPPRRLLRISAQAYNSRSDYQRLAQAVRSLEAGG